MALIEGEFNSYSWPFIEFEIIGPPAEVLTHGAGNISGVDFPAGTGLHSQALLTSLLMSDQAGGKTLRQVSKKLPGLFTDDALYPAADDQRWRCTA